MDQREQSHEGGYEGVVEFNYEERLGGSGWVIDASGSVSHG